MNCFLFHVLDSHHRTKFLFACYVNEHTAREPLSVSNTPSHIGNHKHNMGKMWHINYFVLKQRVSASRINLAWLQG